MGVFKQMFQELQELGKPVDLAALITPADDDIEKKS